jgi:hypothetical protein
MTSNQRRPGFRLPWSSDDEAAAQAAASPANANGGAPSEADADASVNSAPVETASASEDSELEAPATTSPPPTPTDTDMPTPTPSPSPETPEASTDARPAAVAEAAPPPTESSAGFMRDLVAAMRRVAEETRQAGLSDLRAKSEEQVQKLEADSERLREELRSRAEADIAGVAAWASSEEDRIKREAEQRVVGRRAQLDQQLAAETTRAQGEAQALRDRVAAYEAELDAYHAQLSDIADPAAFASAAKNMPSPPRLAGVPAAAEAPAVAAVESVADTASEPTVETPVETADDVTPTPEIHPAEEEVLTARLAELDATLDAGGSAGEAAGSDAPRTESAATEVLVKGLGSFGAITGFRQSLASVEGIDGVSLSLGPTGEFVFRAIHAAGFDVAAAIKGLEGDAVTIEERPEGGLRVTLDRAR